MPKSEGNRTINSYKMHTWYGYVRTKYLYDLQINVPGLGGYTTMHVIFVSINCNPGREAIREGTASVLKKTLQALIYYLRYICNGYVNDPMNPSRISCNLYFI